MAAVARAAVPRHWGHCSPPKAPLDIAVLSDIQRRQQRERKIPRKEHGRIICWDVPDPAPFSAHRLLSFLICHPEMRRRGLKIGCQRSIIKEGCKVLLHCLSAEVVCPCKTINMLFKASLRCAHIHYLRPLVCWELNITTAQCLPSVWQIQSNSVALNSIQFPTCVF